MPSCRPHIASTTVQSPVVDDCHHGKPASAACMLPSHASVPTTSSYRRNANQVGWKAGTTDVPRGPSTGYVMPVRYAHPMKRSLVILTLVLALTGCTPTTPESEPSTPPIASVEPSPTPTMMTDEEAGAYYTATVCETNNQVAKFNSVWLNPDSTLEELHAVAREGIDITRIAVERFEDTDVIWPDAITDDIATIVKQIYAEIGTMNAIANSSSLNEVWSQAFSSVEGIAEAGPRIRVRLGLDSDTNAGC